MDFPNKESIEREVKQVIADCLGVETSTVNSRDSFGSLGIESLTFTGMELLLQDKYDFGDDDVKVLYSQAVHANQDVFDYLTVEKLIDYINSKNERESLA